MAVIQPHAAGRRSRPPTTGAATLFSAVRISVGAQRFTGVLLAAGLAATVATPAGAAPKAPPAPTEAAGGANDAKAEKLRTDAIDGDYLAVKLPAALKKLEQAVLLCKWKRCSAPVLARVLRDKAVVLLASKKSDAEVSKVLKEALAADGSLKLTKDTATPELTALFKQARKELGLAPGQRVTGDIEHVAPPEQQVRHPVPLTVRLSSKVAPSIKRVRVRYRVGQEGWTVADLKPADGGAFGVELPCDAVAQKGEVAYFYEALDGEGEVVASSGSKSKPFTLQIVKELEDDAPPPVPGREAPAECAAKRAAEPEVAAPPAPPPTTNRGLRRNLLTLGFEQDMLFLPAADPVCANKTPYRCFDKSVPLTELVEAGQAPTPDVGNSLKGGAVLSTQRILLGYERALGDNLTVGARAGLALGLGPKDKETVLLAHFEVAGSYYLASLAAPGVKPYLSLAAGVAQFDGKQSVKVELNPPDELGYAPEDRVEYKVDAWRKTGMAFAAPALGVAGLVPAGPGYFVPRLEARVAFAFPTFGVAPGLFAGLGYAF